MSIKHDHTWNPITALEFYEHDGILLLLAGEGPYLKIFEASTSKLLVQCKIFEDQSIHGIIAQRIAESSNSLQLVIWGGPHLQLLTKFHFEKILSHEIGTVKGGFIQASDWVLDAAFSPVDFYSCALVTAHNSVLRARLDGTTGHIVLDPESSPSRSILYSAHIIWEAQDLMLVAAGTVFGEIIVWECSPKASNRVLGTFTGHEGSIFGVNISPAVERTDGTPTRILASCSDDRTIRVWELPTDAVQSFSENASSLSGTGMASNDDTHIDISEPITTVMAHASRIWRVRFIIDEAAVAGQSAMGLLSFGEDATTIHWKLDLESAAAILAKNVADSKTCEVKKLNGNLRQLETFDFHSGKHIWAPVVYQIANRTIVGTGGSDGKISMFEIESTPSSAPASEDLEIVPRKIASSEDSWELETILETLASTEAPMPEPVGLIAPGVQEITSTDAMDGKTVKKKKKAKKVPKDSFNRYSFISENTFVLTSTFGRVLQCKIGHTMQWRAINLPALSSDDLKSYSVLVSFLEIGQAYFAGANGKIFGYQAGHDAIVEVANVGTKVADMFSIYEAETKTRAFLVTVLMSSSAHLIFIDNDTSRLPRKLDFALPEKFIVTSAATIAGLLVLGSRSGSIVLFAPEFPAMVLASHKPPQRTTEDAISNIIGLPTEDSSRAHAHFLTTSRDGTFSIFSVFTPPLSIHQIHHGTSPLATIEKAWLTPTNELHLYGFKSKSFIVWNPKTSSEITRVDCGGAHRSYAYAQSTKNPSSGTLIYTKASKLHLHSHDGNSHTIIKDGGHGREIKACAVNRDQKWLATGAEDTSIRIWSYRSASSHSTEHGSFKPEALLQKHATGIQHLAFHTTPSKQTYLFSSGGNEEFFIWSLSTIPSFGVGAVCEATLEGEERSEERDLRIMSFDIVDLPYESGPGGLLISLAYSDSTVRVYEYQREMGFSRLGHGRYTSSCITQLRYLKVDEEEVYILTGATDGYLSVWHLPFASSPEAEASATVKEIRILETIKVHQNTIKSLALMQKEDGRTVVITGGDDNALGITILPLCSTIRDATPVVSILKSAHAAAITGLDIVSSKNVAGGRRVLKVASCSNDQRIKKWEINISDITRDDEKARMDIKIKLLANEYASVADAADLCVFRARGRDESEETKVLIVGNGMEVWDVDVN